MKSVVEYFCSVFSFVISLLSILSVLLFIPYIKQISEISKIITAILSTRSVLFFSRIFVCFTNSASSSARFNDIIVILFLSNNEQISFFNLVSTFIGTANWFLSLKMI